MNHRAVIYSSPAVLPGASSVMSVMHQYDCSDFQALDVHRTNSLMPGTLYITTLEPKTILQAGVSTDRAVIVYRNTRSFAM